MSVSIEFVQPTRAPKKAPPPELPKKYMPASHAPAGMTLSQQLTDMFIGDDGTKRVLIEQQFNGIRLRVRKRPKTRSNGKDTIDFDYNGRLLPSFDGRLEKMTEAIRDHLLPIPVNTAFDCELVYAKRLEIGQTEHTLVEPGQSPYCILYVYDAPFYNESKSWTLWERKLFLKKCHQLYHGPREKVPDRGIVMDVVWVINDEAFNDEMRDGDDVASHEGRQMDPNKFLILKDSDDPNVNTFVKRVVEANPNAKGVVLKDMDNVYDFSGKKSPEYVIFHRNQLEDVLAPSEPASPEQSVREDNRAPEHITEPIPITIPEVVIKKAPKTIRQSPAVSVKSKPQPKPTPHVEDAPASSSTLVVPQTERGNFPKGFMVSSYPLQSTHTKLHSIFDQLKEMLSVQEMQSVLIEQKFDGIRVRIHVNDKDTIKIYLKETDKEMGNVRISGRIKNQLKEYVPANTMLDCELVVYDNKKNQMQSSAATSAASKSANVPFQFVKLFVFDVPMYAGDTSLTLLERKAAISTMSRSEKAIRSWSKLTGSPIQFRIVWVDENPKDTFKKKKFLVVSNPIDKNGVTQFVTNVLMADKWAEGFVLKNTASTYTFMTNKDNRSKDWVKFKPEHTGCFLAVMNILHYTTPKDAPGEKHAVASLPRGSSHEEMGLFPSGRHGPISAQHAAMLRVVEAKNLARDATMRMWVIYDVRFPYYDNLSTTLLFPRLVSEKNTENRSPVTFDAFRTFLHDRTNVVRAVLDADITIMDATAAEREYISDTGRNPDTP
jgi:hypothetical protein